MSRKKEYYTLDGKQYELSPSMTCAPIFSWHISVCEVCKNYDAATRNCNKLGQIPAEYANCEKYNCPERDIDETHGLYEALKRQLYAK